MRVGRRHTDTRAPGSLAPGSGWPVVDARAAARLAETAREAFEREHTGDLVAVDTANVVDLRRRHPELFGDATAGELAETYARQADELARLVEDWDAASRRYARAVTTGLGELHVVLDELAARLAASATGSAS